LTTLMSRAVELGPLTTILAGVAEGGGTSAAVAEITTKTNAAIDNPLLRSLV
jgi:hypothetical protein